MDQKVREPLLKRDIKRAPSPGRSDPSSPSRPKPRSGWVTFWQLVVVLAIGGAGYEIYHLATTAPATTARTGRGGGAASSVGAASAVTGTIQVFVNALGTVTPLATVTVQSQISGVLTKVAFTEGQILKKGDFLAQIDPRPYEALKAQYEGQLARDQGLLDQARVDNTRYQTLLSQNSIARQQAEDQAYVVQQDEGTVRIDQALIDAQALNISYCRIVSPVDGRIGLRMVDEGNYIQASSTTGLGVITQQSPTSVLFPVAEDDLSEIAPQVAAGTRLQATVFDRSNVKQLAVGSVTTLDNQIDTTTGTVKLRAVFDNSDGVLFPNQFVNVKLLVKTLTNAITVPQAAIQRGLPGTFVYVIGADSKVSVRKVVLGPVQGDTIAITKGLEIGEKVVVDGADRLRDGGQVSVVALDGKPTAPRGGAAGGAGGEASGKTPGETSGEAAPRDPSRHHKPASGDSGQSAPPSNTQ